MSLASVVKSAMGSLGSDFVRAGTIVRVATGGYNPTTGTALAREDVRSTVSGPLEDVSEREIDGTLVLRGDQVWTVPASGISLVRKNDVVDFGETNAAGDRVRYTVVDPRPVYAGENVALYRLLLRR